MAKSPKLGPNTPHTVADQIRWYEEQLGKEKADEQVRLAKLKSGKCICTPVTRKIDGQNRSTHSKECPKWKEWMGEGVRDNNA